MFSTVSKKVNPTSCRRIPPRAPTTGIQDSPWPASLLLLRLRLAWTHHMLAPLRCLPIGTGSFTMRS
ncbi:predicted protein [Plenodomus lingam JN3]|uniref:Predicted protein n=1 Tax=Leptosphaeria maculans (strain JN3 / isolate v23.1.3 / race Av1-4-5-6-7-8) TaxID=985895 RepID=E4ZMB7_LEPMJ|nr:predicted protein [Plenodomus lingam JN3]CBX92466.1 predicted protein [Plenodomus lingam JN3]